MVLTFSGGGTRAAALADGVGAGDGRDVCPRRGRGQRPLASQIDLVSSVSGGSVTAAYLAMDGAAGLAALERDFLYNDVMKALITRTLLDPLQLFQPRIDILESYLDEQVFHGKT